MNDKTPSLRNSHFNLDTATLWAETWLRNSRNMPGSHKCSTSTGAIALSTALGGCSKMGQIATWRSNVLPVLRKTEVSFPAIAFSIRETSGSMGANTFNGKSRNSVNRY
jgi:hypothetical protein